MNYTILVQGGLQAVDAKAETDSKEIYDPKFFEDCLVQEKSMH